jgi:hypothetical protein
LNVVKNVNSSTSSPRNYLGIWYEAYNTT